MRPILTIILIVDVENPPELAEAFFTSLRRWNRRGMRRTQVILITQKELDPPSQRLAARQPFPVSVVHAEHKTVGGYAENEIRKDFTTSERVAILDAIETKPLGDQSRSQNFDSVPFSAGGLEMRFIRRTRAGSTGEVPVPLLCSWIPGKTRRFLAFRPTRRQRRGTGTSRQQILGIRIPDEPTLSR